MDLDSIIPFIVVIIGFIISAIEKRKKLVHPEESGNAKRVPQHSSPSPIVEQPRHPVSQPEPFIPQSVEKIDNVDSDYKVDYVVPIPQPELTISENIAGPVAAKPVQPIRQQPVKKPGKIEIAVPISEENPYGIEHDLPDSTEEWRKAIIASEILKTKF